jgi:putative transcriptional regulator
VLAALQQVYLDQIYFTLRRADDKRQLRLHPRFAWILGTGATGGDRIADLSLSARSVRHGQKSGLLSNDIRTLRFHHNEQQDLADKIGITRQTVNAIEANKYSPSLEVAFRIARVFQVPLQEVFQYGE